MRRLSLIYGNFKRRGIEEAPSDGKQYARKDAAWSEVESGGVTLEELLGSSKYGFLYNWWAVTDARNIAAEGMSVPSYLEVKTLREYIDSAGSPTSNTAGGTLKLTGLDYWNSPNTGATNEYNFNLKGSGDRASGSFGGSLKAYFNGWLTTEYPYDSTRAAIYRVRADNETLLHYVPMEHWFYTFKNNGLAVRLVRPATTEEQLLLDGTYVDDYVGNNGRRYKCVKIGTQVWLAEPLMETKYRNGDAITGPTFTNVEWAALTTEAYCIYNDDPTNAGTTGSLQHNLTEGIEGDGTIHISEAEKQKIADAITDAPSDGNDYVRKDGAWAVGGGGSAPGTITSATENDDTGTEHTHELDNVITAKSVSFANITVDSKGRVTSATSGSPFLPVKYFWDSSPGNTIEVTLRAGLTTGMMYMFYCIAYNGTTAIGSKSMFLFLHNDGTDPVIEKNVLSDTLPVDVIFDIRAKTSTPSWTVYYLENSSSNPVTMKITHFVLY